MTPSTTTRSIIPGRFLRALGSPRLALSLLLVGLLGFTLGALVESSGGREFARASVYRAPWFELYLGLLVVNLLASTLERARRQPHAWSRALTHSSVVLLVFGFWASRSYGYEGWVEVNERATSDTLLLNDLELVLSGLGTAAGVEHRYTLPSAPSTSKEHLQRETELLPGVDLLGIEPDLQAHLEQHAGLEDLAGTQERPPASPSVDVPWTAEGDPSSTPCVHLRIDEATGRRELWIALGDSRFLETSGEAFELSFSRSHRHLPFSIHLEDADAPPHDGGPTHEDPATRIILSDLSGVTPTLAADVALDRPLDYMGFRLIRSRRIPGADEDSGETVLLVAYDPGLTIVYVGFILLLLGGAWFLFGEGQRRRRSQRGSPEPVVWLRSTRAPTIRQATSVQPAGGPPILDDRRERPPKVPTV